MRFDLHIHSKYSGDCNLGIEAILIQAVKRSLDGVAICDHDTVKGGLMGNRRAEELGLVLVVIPGIEVSTSKGHLLVLGASQDIPSEQTPQETIERARELGAITIAPHPYKKKNSLGDVSDLRIDAVETLNSRCHLGLNEKARRMAEHLKKPMVAGSDSHILEMIGCSYTEIDAQPEEGEILEAIRRGKTRAKGGNASSWVMLKHMLRYI